VPLYLTESEIAELVDPALAVDAIEACFRRMAAGEVEIAPRRRLRLPEGSLADMAAADNGIGLSGGKLYVATATGVTFVSLSSTPRPPSSWRSSRQTGSAS
jgi:ornithine cyclodeaminase/alanine dehydrogenase-like protein (mu-crystallin family)